MSNRHLVTSVDGMVAQLVNLVSKGYRYYFVGAIDDPGVSATRDLRMLGYYEAGLPKWTRERRKRRGLANFRYLRHEDWFIVLATEGQATRFWSENRHRIRDIRNVPIRFKGYSISYRQGGWKDRRLWADSSIRERDMKWHVRVQLDAETYEGLKAYFLNIATHRQSDFLAGEFAELTFQPYRPVREQLFQVLRAVNRVRHLAGYQRVPASVIRFKRRIVSPFARGDSHLSAALRAMPSQSMPQTQSA
jgi:hypothetical protein